MNFKQSKKFQDYQFICFIVIFMETGFRVLLQMHENK